MTVPVQYGARSTRGFFDRSSDLSTVGLGHQDTQVLVAATVLHIQTGSLGDLAQDTAIEIGAVGAADLSGGSEAFNIQDTQLEDDGLITAVIVAGGNP